MTKGHKSRRIAEINYYCQKFTFLLLVDRAITVDDGYDRYDEEGYYYFVVMMMICVREKERI